jgi:biofilm PGA synthesis N-glycosyltransferase PgaC
MFDFEWPKGFIELVFNFAFYYPLFMSYLWMIGGVYYFFHWERMGSQDPSAPPKLKEYPAVSVLVPAHNEGANIAETVAWLDAQDYPNFDIIAINDGSTDDTGEILDCLAGKYDRLRVLHLATNQGKAMALRMGVMATRSEFLVCIDGDALLEKHATTWLMYHMVSGPRVGAVTGNPRIRTRSTLLGRVQVGEFSSIIGLIKRAQRIYGRIYTVSGVVAAFRKTALQRCGYWGTNMVTEDIDVSWNLQLNYWDIRYEPNALCWILMPETIKGLWKQRLRWSQGGAEVLLKYASGLLQWKKRRMWGVYIEFITSVLWAYSMAIIIALWLVGLILPMPSQLYIDSVLPRWHGVVLGITCLLQFAVSLILDSRYEKGLLKVYYWIIWYPLLYWVLNMLVTVVAVPKALFKPRGKRAVWVSPDRGLRPA